MNLLLDTHAFLWFCQGDPALSAAAKLHIENPANRKLLSLASKLTLGEPSSKYIPEALARTGFELLPVALAHATAVELLTLHHRDPFDRLLVAQALTENVPIVSSDPLFDAYPIKRLW